MVTVSGNPNPTYRTNPTNPTNPTTKYRCEFVNLNCICTHIYCSFNTFISFLTSGYVRYTVYYFMKDYIR